MMRDRSVSFDSLGFSKARFAKRASEAERVPELVLVVVYRKGQSLGRLLNYTRLVIHDPMLRALLDQALEFPWQQTLLDAFIEWRPAYLRGKINAAERAIAARLCDRTDLNERIALGDALRTLCILFSKEVSDEKYMN
jgi:hypothetical protein